MEDQMSNISKYRWNRVGSYRSIAYFLWTCVSHRSSRRGFEKAFCQIDSEMPERKSETRSIDNVQGNLRLFWRRFFKLFVTMHKKWLIHYDPEKLKSTPKQWKAFQVFHGPKTVVEKSADKILFFLTTLLSFSTVTLLFQKRFR